MPNLKQISRREVPATVAADWPEGLHPVVRRVCAARGLTPLSLDQSLSGLIPVSQLENVETAAERLLLARTEQQSVLVLGDFDADGATATALVMICLQYFGFARAGFLVPDRQRYGYGLSEAIVAVAAESKPDLIVTVDNGVSSHAGVHAANQRGIDVLVTDHHLPGNDLPDACVIVNPNLDGSRFQSKALAGVGVAFYVMAALGQRLASEGLISASAAREICANCLDLVALGTVADLVPLDHNNRLLVSQGLSRIRAGRCRPGIQSLFSLSGRNIADATTADLGFAVAPSLNAAGRLKDMTIGINCLLADEAERAMSFAAELSQLNMQRKQVQLQMQTDAEGHIDAIEEKLGSSVSDAVCLYDPKWHQGVVGLVATRIRERINRPVIAFAPAEDGFSLKGSGRSIRGVHIRDVLAGVDAHYPNLIERYGGHAMAAGLTLAADRLDDFRQAFMHEVARYSDQIDDIDRLWSDGELAADEINLTMAEMLRHVLPWGQGCPEPMFDGLFEIVNQRIVGERHLKLKVKPAGGGASLDGIAFNHGELLSGTAGQHYRLVYKLDVNEFRQVRNHQLVVEHIECV